MKLEYTKDYTLFEVVTHYYANEESTTHRIVCEPHIGIEQILAYVQSTFGKGGIEGIRHIDYPVMVVEQLQDD